MKKEIEAEYLKQKINEKKSSYDVARSLGVSQSTVVRKAKEFGLQFKGKSVWRKL